MDSVLHLLGIARKAGRVEVGEEPVGAAARDPADVVRREERPEAKSCRGVFPDDQLSLASGKEGQNARLAAKLTGYKIDIKPASAPLEPIEEMESAPVEETAADEAPVEAVEE